MLERSLQTALCISAALHSLIFLSLSPRMHHDRRSQNIKVEYLAHPPKPPREAKPVTKKELLDLKERVNNTEKLLAAARLDKAEFSAREKKPRSLGGEFLPPKPLSVKEPFPAFKKRVTLPQIAPENSKIKSPSYTGYYELVREKIRRSAYSNYAQTDTGEVYIAFVVGADGALRDVRYIEDKSSPSYYLKDISMRSIRDAAPFPAFPGDLDYPQLSFNVIISFQIDEK